MPNGIQVMRARLRGDLIFDGMLLACLLLLGCSEAGKHWLVIPSSDDGISIVMIGSDTCPTSSAFQPLIAKHQEALGVFFTYVDQATLSEEFRLLPVPLFLVVKDEQILDVHGGIIHPINSFAPKGNHEILNTLLIRSGIKSGDPWQLLEDRGELKTDPSHSGISFQDHEGKNIAANLSFAVLSGVSFRNADLLRATFDHTIFSHVDLRGAKLPKVAADKLLIINSLCPDGSRSTPDWSCS